MTVTPFTNVLDAEQEHATAEDIAEFLTVGSSEPNEEQAEEPEAAPEDGESD